MVENDQSGDFSVREVKEDLVRVLEQCGLSMINLWALFGNWDNYVLPWG